MNLDDEMDDDEMLDHQKSEDQIETLDKDKSDALIEKNKDRYISKNASWGRLMGYYKPCWINLILSLLAFINSFSFTIQGLFVVAYQYVYTHWYNPDVIEDPVYWRNTITLIFIAEIAFMSFI